MDIETASPTAEDYAVVVGIARYPDKNLGDLKGPENDARAFYNWLLSPTGGNIVEEKKGDHVTLILSSSFDATDDPLQAKPMLAEVESVLDRLVLQGQNNDGRAGRRLYIFFAGHGFAPTLEDAALLMANAGRGRMGYHIPGRLYALWFRTAAYFDEVVLLMDCCRDDYPSARIHLPPWDDIRDPLGRKVRHFYGFATEWTRKSRERLIPADGNEVHGLFTAALMEGLNGGARDEQGQITGASLKAFILNYLPELIKSLQQSKPDAGFQEPGKDQTPKFDFDETTDIVFVPAPKASLVSPSPFPTDASALDLTPVKITFTAPHQNVWVEIQDGQFQPVAKTLASAAPWEIALKPGLYRLNVPDLGQKQILEVIGGETVHVEF